jgi:hypothetical protein
MRKAKLIGKIFGITLAILMVGAMSGPTALSFGDLDKNQVSGQEDPSYITVHALNTEGIEIASIEGEELFVSALVEGVNFTAASTGIYRFTIIGGAFELCPPDHPDWWGWKTEILIYKNRPIFWSGGWYAPEHPNPANWDFSVGSPHFQPTYEAAETTGKGMFVNIALAENEYVILVVNDSKGHFLDNSGGVYFSITVLPPAPVQYDLTIYSSAGGSVTEPGEGTFTYDVGAVVDLVAEAEEGYRFINWTGTVYTIADVEDATTTITVEDNYSITANFEEEPSGGACFIATAAYGTPMAEEIEILGEFRDEYLLTSALGQALVDLYYRVSPPIADFITEHPSLKPIVRAGLLPAVAISTVAVNTTPAEKMAIVGLLALAVWVTRRRGRGPEYT